MIQWCSKYKNGDAIPWLYNPRCSIRGCGEYTEYVANSHLGFKGATTYCKKHAPVKKLKIDTTSSKLLEEKEKSNIDDVISGKITESSLYGKNYFENKLV